MADTVKIATRDSYGKALVEMGKTNEKLVVLDADLAAATKTGGFKKAFPERFFDSGIAECNMMCIAGGLSTMGYTVFASTFAMFAAGRAFEQVRNTIGYPRTIPGMTIINPADDVEARQAVYAAAALDGPVYLRFGRLAVPVIFGEDYKFEIGKGALLTEGTDVTIIATCLMVGEAIAAAELLKADGISAAVVNMATIKPIDREIILNAAKTTGAIVTAEEHNIIGGLGSAVAEVVCETIPVPVVRLGVEDTFGRSGPALELLHVFGLDAANIAQKAKAAVALKK